MTHGSEHPVKEITLFPFESMAIKGKFPGKTTLKIFNENKQPASITFNGEAYFVPGAEDDASPGVVTLSQWMFFKSAVIKSHSAWPLRIER